MNKKIHKWISSKFGGRSCLFLEIGAHFGEDSRIILGNLPNARMFLFEADPRNVKVLRRYLSDPRVTIVPAAVCSVNGFVDLYFCRRPGADFSYIPPKHRYVSREVHERYGLTKTAQSSIKTGHKSTNEKVSVPAIRLDSWARKEQIGSVDFLWIDVQGAERDVVDGARELLSHVRFVWLEYGETKYDGAMSRKETIHHLGSRFRVVGGVSSKSRKGDLLLRNVRYG